MKIKNIYFEDYIDVCPECGSENICYDVINYTSATCLQCGETWEVDKYNKEA